MCFQRSRSLVYGITRTMSGKISRQSKPVNRKEGVTFTTQQDQRTRWVEHFREIRPPPTDIPKITATEAPLLNVNVNSPGPDGIPFETLKEDPKIYNSHVIPAFPSDLGNGEGSIGMEECLPCKLPKKGGLGLCKD